MAIGLLNVVTGAFIVTAVDVATKDRELVVKHEIKMLRSYLHKVTEFFNEADVDGSGMLSFEEFKRHLKDQHISAYFHSLGLDVSQAEMLFNLLDRDNSGTLTLDEFLGGCMRLKGPVKNLDVNVLIDENRRLSTIVKELRDSTLADFT